MKTKLEITLLNDELNMNEVMEVMENENVKYPEDAIQVGTYEDFISEWIDYLSADGGNGLCFVPADNIYPFVAGGISTKVISHLQELEYDANEVLEELIGDNMQEFVEYLADIYGLGNDLNTVDSQAYDIEINGETYYWMYR